MIKKFEAKTEEEAILRAKEELGKDAIVMNIRTIKPKGLYHFFRKPTVEVTAAIDDEAKDSDGEKLLSELQRLQKEKESEEARKREAVRNNPNIIVEDEEEKAPEEAELPETAIEQKLNKLQSLLERQMQPGEEKGAKAPSPPEEKKENKSAVYTNLILKQLTANEVEEKYALQIINEISRGLREESGVDNVLSSVYQKIILKIGQIRTIQLEEGAPKFLFFVGPTGVGKTTTLAKLASELKIKRKASIALATADTYRIAAVEQLRTYASILDIPLKVVYAPEELSEAREEFADYDLVLVDTAGRSHQSSEQLEDLREILCAIPEEERETYLVLSAATKYKDLQRIAEAYGELTRYSLLFTKLDETECMGSMLNLRMMTGAPLSYATFGQNVPDDIRKIDAQDIAKNLLGGNH